MRAPAAFLLLCAAALSPPGVVEADAVQLPTFLTEGRKWQIVTSDTVVLPCEVSNPGSYVLVWKRGIAVLTAGSTKVTPDPRMRLVDGYNLEIRDVQTTDAGDYVCQIGTLQPQEITHTVEILVPPIIQYVSKQGNVDVRKGSEAKLECRASGNPVPTITWTRKNNVLPSGEKTVAGSSLTIEQVNRHHAGLYQCTASNSVGQPVSHDINLRVMYAPEITVERTWVHAGEGFEAQLVCIVHAEPAAEVLWYRGSLRLDSIDNRIMENRGNRHTLILRRVSSSDFGNYSCEAANSMGREKKYIELSGRPNQATFASTQLSRWRDSYNISWTVKSYISIEEYKLYYRTASGMGDPLYTKKALKKVNDTLGLTPPQQNRGEWHDVVIPAVPDNKFIQHMAYMIHGLEPGTTYEATVKAKNRFGWSQMSDTFQFTTRTLDNSLYEPSPEPAVFSDQEVRGMGVTAYKNQYTLGNAEGHVTANMAIVFTSAIFLFRCAAVLPTCGCLR